MLSYSNLFAFLLAIAMSVSITDPEQHDCPAEDEDEREGLGGIHGVHLL